ncbi:hypothetical protein Pint_20521 [Pistacia integerrima]|uniref:Uncharacterized protein n=1 Tax=Pistacia integerrima TaxID=434235 RepID=A0ACC0X9X1_9ROSI|nr:hypothetical protein Pint_20521 [Pistacia integerrima]
MPASPLPKASPVSTLHLLHDRPGAVINGPGHSGSISMVCPMPTQMSQGPFIVNDGVYFPPSCNSSH